MRLPAIVAAVVVALPAPALAQLGEVHVGALLGYGSEDAYGPGAGIIGGVAAGRIAYAGVRWTYHLGNETRVTTLGGELAVRNRVQVFAADLGLLLPVGAFEVVPGVSVGVVRFAQRARPTGGGGPPPSRADATEFFVAPGLSIHGRVAGLAVIPELQYSIAGDPRLPWRTPHRGVVASLRLVLAFEVGRIRH